MADKKCPGAEKCQSGARKESRTHKVRGDGKWRVGHSAICSDINPLGNSRGIPVIITF